MSNRLKTESGFTLLEVMIALAILGIGLGVCLQLFSGSLNAVKKSGEYTDATFLARHKLEEWLLKADIKEDDRDSGTFEGDFSKFSWEVNVSPYQYAEENITGNLGANDNQMEIKMLQINVKITWEEGEKTHQLELATSRVYLVRGNIFS